MVMLLPYFRLDTHLTIKNAKPVILYPKIDLKKTLLYIFHTLNPIAM